MFFLLSVARSSKVWTFPLTLLVALTSFVEVGCSLVFFFTAWLTLAFRFWLPSRSHARLVLYGSLLFVFKYMTLFLFRCPCFVGLLLVWLYHLIQIDPTWYVLVHALLLFVRSRRVPPLVISLALTLSALALVSVFVAWRTHSLIFIRTISDCEKALDF